MASGMVEVQDPATGERLWRWPVDARELIAMGVCEPADEATRAIAGGLAAFPFVGNARRTASPMTPELTAPTVLVDVVQTPKSPKKAK